MSPSKRCVVNVKLVFPRSSLPLFKDPLLHWFELACMDLCKMITCPTEALICGSKSNLLEMKVSPVPITQWFDWVLHYYSSPQHVEIQLSSAFILKISSTLISNCCDESLLKCCLRYSQVPNIISLLQIVLLLSLTATVTYFETSAKQSWSIERPFLNGDLQYVATSLQAFRKFRLSGNRSLSKASIRRLCSRCL